MRVSLLIIGGVIVALVAAGGVLFFALDYGIEQPRDERAAVETIEIPRGIGSGKIGELLEERGIIRHRYLWYYYLWRQGVSHKLQAGEYELSGAMTIPAIAEKMVRGEAISRGRKVTIPEGFTFDEIEARLGEAGLHILTLDSDMQRLKIREGYLFPDTYLFDEDVMGEYVVRTMNENFYKKIEPLKDGIASSGRTLEEIIIMASLIEEEIPHVKDRPIAAGILWKRLDIGMPLQVDATVLYAKGIRGGAGETRTITKEDLALDSPYNTYKHAGLPPGAIANPGLGAIRAALFPVKSDYWYYLSKPDGETIFSKTAEEHSRAKTKYLR